jgi:histone H3/H4
MAAQLAPAAATKRRSRVPALAHDVLKLHQPFVDAVHQRSIVVTPDGNDADARRAQVSPEAAEQLAFMSENIMRDIVDQIAQQLAGSGRATLQWEDVELCVQRMLPPHYSSQIVKRLQKLHTRFRNLTAQ